MKFSRSIQFSQSRTVSGSSARRSAVALMNVSSTFIASKTSLSSAMNSSARPGLSGMSTSRVKGLPVIQPPGRVNELPPLTEVPFFYQASHHVHPRHSELCARKNLLPQVPLSELPDPKAPAGRLRPPSPDANLESILQTANPYAPVLRSNVAPIAEPAQHRTTCELR